VLWSVPAKTAARADYLGSLSSKTVIAGGVEEYRLADPPAAGSARAVVTAYAVKGGAVQWTWKAPAATTAHVVGTDGSRVVVATRTGSQSALIGLDADGKQVWRSPQRGVTFESTLRDGVVLVRDGQTLAGYDVSTGKVRWQKPIPPKPTYFPYGFTLDQMPSLDADHVLLPTTTALRILDLATGKDVAYPLPTDGINTTYWPYQLLVTGTSVGVITNTGAILTNRGS
jgi:hypothetical protein